MIDTINIAAYVSMLLASVPEDPRLYYVYQEASPKDRLICSNDLNNLIEKVFEKKKERKGAKSEAPKN